MKNMSENPISSTYDSSSIKVLKGLDLHETLKNQNKILKAIMKIMSDPNAKVRKGDLEKILAKTEEGVKKSLKLIE